MGIESIRSNAQDLTEISLFYLLHFLADPSGSLPVSREVDPMLSCCTNTSWEFPMTVLYYLSFPTSRLKRIYDALLEGGRDEMSLTSFGTTL